MQCDEQIVKINTVSITIQKYNESKFWFSVRYRLAQNKARTKTI